MNSDISNSDNYEFVILGSGQAGTNLAWDLAKQGKRVAVVERKYVGGSCPNIACLPTKNIIHSAKVASLFARNEEFGIHKGEWKVVMEGVRERKRRMVTGLDEMLYGVYKATGADYIVSSGAFVAPKTVEVSLAGGGTRLLYGEKIIISTGTRAAIQNIPGLSDAKPLTHIEALELDEIPGHLLIIGGGFIGLEFAKAMRRFGSRVTIIERGNRLAAREDGDVSEGLQNLFLDEGVEIILNALISKVEGQSGASVKLRIKRAGIETVLEGTHLLVATGRIPNTDGIGLELAGVELTERGTVKVNERLETTAPEVWAVGDCAGSPNFTHVAHDDYRVVRDNLAGGARVTTGRYVPYCVFTDPEFARIGLSESEAKAAGIPYRLTKMPFGRIPRANTLSETRGFIKALIETDGDRILGFAAFGTGAGDLVSVVQVAMIAGQPYTILRDAIFTHPTLPEGLGPLFSGVSPRLSTNRTPFEVLGCVNLHCRSSVAETVSRLEAQLELKGIKVFARIDQRQEAAEVGLTMRPMVLLIFGAPKMGVPLMIAHPSLAIDVPFKALIWEAEDGTVWLTYNAPELLEQRHNITSRPFDGMVNILKAVASKSTT